MELRHRSLAIATLLTVGGLACAVPLLPPDPQHAPPGGPPVSEELRLHCEQHLCRGPQTIRIADDRGQPLDIEIAGPEPLVEEDMVTILPGETLHIEAREWESSLVDLRAVRVVEDPARTLTLSFWQEPASGDGSDMMLRVENGFDHLVKYRLGMQLPGSNEIYYTSSCPVLPGRLAYEHWPHAIVRLFVSDFVLLAPNDDGSIECD